MADETTKEGRPAVTVVATVAAPMVTALVATILLYGIFLLGVDSDHDNVMVPPPLLWLFLSSALFAVTLTVQLLFHALAFRLEWRSLRTYVWSGAVIGLVAGLVTVVLGRHSDFEDMAYAVGYLVAPTFGLVLCGAFNAWVFWVIRRPDKDPDRRVVEAFE